MAVEHLCQRHGRPAVASRVRLRQDGTQETEYLCELDLAEERMSSRSGGRSLFDESERHLLTLRRQRAGVRRAELDPLGELTLGAKVLRSDS